MSGPFTTPVALSVPMENRDVRDNDFQALNVQDGLEEIDFRRETKDPTGFLNLDESAISFDKVTRTFTIAPIGAEFTYYIHGHPFVITAPASIVIPDTVGVWFFYLDDNSSLIASQTHVDFGGVTTPTAALYWNTVIQDDVWFGDIRTNLSMGWGAKQRAHNVDRVQARDSDFIIHDKITDGDGSLDSHAQISILDGHLHHADITRLVVDAAIPTVDWEQHLLNIAQIPIFYKEGENLLHKKASNNFPFIEDGVNTSFFNEEITPGNWQLTNCSNNKFFAVYLFITMDPRHPVIGVLGNVAASSPSGTLDSNLLIPIGEAFESFGFLKALIFQTSTNFTNSVKTRLFAVTDVNDTLSTDRYMITAGFGGNANNNRILEYNTWGSDSQEQPLLMPEDSLVRTVTLQAASNIGVGRVIGFYINNGNTLVFKVTVLIGGLDSHQFDVTESFLKGDEVTIKVLNGPISKPLIRFWIETNL